MSRSNHRWYRYGLSQDDYDSRLAEQGGLCGVCRSAPKIIMQKQDGINFDFVEDNVKHTSENAGCIV